MFARMGRVSPYGTRPNSGSFRKGLVPWNKGTKGVVVAWNKDLKGIHLNPKNEFRTGEVAMEKSPSWKGGVQKNVRDCAYVAVAPYVRARRPLMVYEAAHGKIPPGYVIYHLNGNKDDDSLENLVAIPRSELIRRNNKLI